MKEEFKIEGVENEDASKVEEGIIQEMKRAVSKEEQEHMKTTMESYKKAKAELAELEEFIRLNAKNRALHIQPQLYAARKKAEKLRQKEKKLSLQIVNNKKKMASNLTLISNSKNEIDRLVREGVITPFEASKLRTNRKIVPARKILLLHEQPKHELQRLAKEEEERRQWKKEQKAGKRLNELKESINRKRQETLQAARERRAQKRKRAAITRYNDEYEEVIDDGSERAYKIRKERYAQSIHAQLSKDEQKPQEYKVKLEKKVSVKKENDVKKEEEEEDDWTLDDEGEETNIKQEEEEINDLALQQLAENLEHIYIDKNFRCLTNTWESLFDYQQTGVQWLWELHQQKVGGIIGDEMGLGKTIQICSFFSALQCSGKFGTSLVLAPASVLKQWIREMHVWAPMIRSCLYHAGGSCQQNLQTKMIDKLIKDQNGLVVTTYESFRRNYPVFLAHRWKYVVLDEGHKLKNPNAEITLICKKLKTPHRIILSGTPIQNNLVELWSLFDFVYPGKLGTLPLFKTHYSIPISSGGYSNATHTEVNSAYECAKSLRDMIAPYLLRRVKKDVKHELPEKTERVLFCHLTKEQVYLYRRYLDSNEMNYTIRHGSNSGMIFKAIQTLRQISNHPDLLLRGDSKDAKLNYGAIERSAKLKALDTILKLWKQKGHKVLLFSQSRMMLDVLEMYLCNNEYEYRRMDGTTSVATRMTIVDEFNSDPNIFVFLLTAKVGGLGLNLTSADRIILYDPNWNPSIDKQALARCWRYGQTRNVVVYRLMTRGTIEEKMYHRQIHKLFLSNKILTDPRQKRFFTNNQLSDLFKLGYEYNSIDDRNTFLSTETGQIFGEIISSSWGGNTKPNKPFHYKHRIDSKNSARSDVKESNDLIYQIESYQDEEKRKKHETSTGNAETDLLTNLFNNNNVASVFDHDKIANRTSMESNIIGRRAHDVAHRSVQALRRSSFALRKKFNEELSSNSSTITPTLTKNKPTKRFGLVKSNTPIKRFGSTTRVPTNTGIPIRNQFPTRPSKGPLDFSNSPQVLKSRHRQTRGASMLSSESLKKALRGHESFSSDVGDPSQFAVRLQHAFCAQPNLSLSTPSLVEHFASITGESNLAIFQSTLRRMANFDPSTKMWTLKEDFISS